MKRVVYFELGANNPQRAADFYGKVFGWEFKKWEGGEPYWRIITGASEEKGIGGGMFLRKKNDADRLIADITEAKNFVLTIQVPSVDDWSKKIIENGGKEIKKKVKIAAVGWLAYLGDTEGNIFGIMESDRSLL